MLEVYTNYTEQPCEQSSFEDFKGSFDSIISNPPYEVKDLTNFLVCLDKILNAGGTAVLLIPNGFVDKERPKAIPEALSKFSIIHREDMDEEFARTKIKAEIIVLSKS